MQIEGCTALVTGANRGIGKAFSEVLLARGAAKVYIAARDLTTLSTADPRLVGVQLDVTDSDRVAGLAEELKDVDLVVNNAGLCIPGTPLSVGLDVARAQLEVNYLGLISMTQAFAPILAANGGGAFINVHSVVSWVSIPSEVGYSASKAAGWSFTNSARIELKRQGTHVVGVYVSFVDTDMLAGYADLEKLPPASVADAALDALVAGEPEAVVDEMSRGVKNALPDDHRSLYPQIERDFEMMVDR